MSLSEPLTAVMPLPKASEAPEPYIPAAFGVPVPLPTIVRRANMEYRQCFREGDVAVYLAKSGNRIEYEVIEVQVLPAGEIGDKFYSAREAFPPSSEWGSLGFSYTNRSHRDPLAAAMKKARQIGAEATQV